MVKKVKSMGEELEITENIVTLRSVALGFCIGFILAVGIFTADWLSGTNNVPASISDNTEWECLEYKDIEKLNPECFVKEINVTSDESGEFSIFLYELVRNKTISFENATGFIEFNYSLESGARLIKPVVVICRGSNIFKPFINETKCIKWGLVRYGP